MGTLVIPVVLDAKERKRRDGECYQWCSFHLTVCAKHPRKRELVVLLFLFCTERDTNRRFCCISSQAFHPSARQSGHLCFEICLTAQAAPQTRPRRLIYNCSSSGGEKK